MLLFVYGTCEVLLKKEGPDFVAIIRLSDGD